MNELVQHYAATGTKRVVLRGAGVDVFHAAPTLFRLFMSRRSKECEPIQLLLFGDRAADLVVSRLYAPYPDLVFTEVFGRFHSISHTNITIKCGHGKKFTIPMLWLARITYRDTSYLMQKYDDLEQRFAR